MASASVHGHAEYESRGPRSDGRTVAKRRTDEQRKAESRSKNMRGPNDEEPSRTGILGAWERADIWTKRILIAIPVLVVIARLDYSPFSRAICQRRGTPRLARTRSFARWALSPLDLSCGRSE